MKKILILLIALMFNISTSVASIYYYTSLEGIVNGADSGLFCDVEDGNCSYDSDMDVNLSFDEESTYLELGVEKTIPYSISGADVDSVILSISSDNEELMDSSTLIIDTENKIITVPAENINQSGEVRIVLQAKDSDGEVVAQAYNYLNIETISSKNMLTLWTVEAGETIQFPFSSSFNHTYDGHVDWGDDSGIETFEGVTIQSLSHTYTEAGTYEIRIDGGFYDETNFHGMFYEQTILEGMDISQWDVSNVGVFQHSFYLSSIKKDINISGWDILNNANILWAFTSSNISGNIIYNTKMSSEGYNNCLHLLSSNGGIQTSSTGQKIIAGENACAADDTNCFIVRKLIINKGWTIEDATIDTDLVIDEDTALESRWTVSAGETVKFPFYPAVYSGIIDWGDGSEIEETNDFKTLTHTYTDAGTYTTLMNGSWGNDLTYMFRNIGSFPSNLDISSWNMINISNVIDMMYNVTLSSNFDISSWDMSNIKIIWGLFQNVTIPGDLNLSSWDLSNASNVTHLFLDVNLNKNIIYDKLVLSKIYSRFITILVNPNAEFPDSTTGQKIYVGDNSCEGNSSCEAAETALTNKGWVIMRTKAN